MNKIDKLNLNDTLEKIDISKLFSKQEIKELHKNNKHKFYAGTKLGIPKSNLLIYIICVSISIGFLLLYCFYPAIQNKTLINIFMSIATSIISAIILAFFTERAMFIRDKKNIIKQYNNEVTNIYSIMDCICK